MSKSDPTVDRENMLVSNNPIENNADLLNKAQHLVDPTVNSHTNSAINENITLPSNVSSVTPKAVSYTHLTLPTKRIV